jgi:hypothetical protein
VDIRKGKKDRRLKRVWGHKNEKYSLNHGEKSYMSKFKLKLLVIFSFHICGVKFKL